MRPALPPVDLHAHVDPTVSDSDVRELGAVVFAATRSLDEARLGLERRDETVVWGVGSHPGVARSHSKFDAMEFRSLVARMAFVGEIGLDGGSKIGLERQLPTLRSVLEVLSELPRICSLHSYQATEVLVAELERHRVRGVVLHWWLGSDSATERALELGCYFSVNAAMFQRPEVFRRMPLERLLTETDHPFGDRSSPAPRRPGNVLPVEYAVGRIYGLQPDEVRQTVWANLSRLVTETGSSHLMSQTVRSYLMEAAASNGRI